MAKEKVVLIGSALLLVGFSLGITIGTVLHGDRLVGAVEGIAADLGGLRRSEPCPDGSVLPDWRMTTDCSAFGKDCVLHRLAEHKYADYPFQLGAKYDHLYEWRTDMPAGWQQALQQSAPKPAESLDQRPAASDQTLECVRKAQATPVQEQLRALLAKLARIDGMVSFTISDFSYAEDMLQDVFEMAHNVIGFSNAFFMVAFDVPTMELACAGGYPFLAWRRESGDALSALKNGVAAAKFELSLALVESGTPFFFFEMDVWFVRSPLSIVRRRLAETDVVYSGHQNNPEAANIGVYAFLANERTIEYLRICVQLLGQSPRTHDQTIMTQVYWFTDQMRGGHPLTFSTHFEDPKPPIPNITMPVTHARFSAHEIVADERPLPTEDTFAIHPLCGTPLMHPHGKKMTAKELGAWVGRSGNYYPGKGGGGRYLWLDGHPWGGYSFVQHFPGFHPHAEYHEPQILRRIVAVTIALARRTGRVWVLPKVLGDYDTQFLWYMLDMQSVEGLVEYRETNFPSNPKAWRDDGGGVGEKFGPVARSALTDGGRMYVQPSADGQIKEGDEGVLAWRTDKVEGGGAGEVGAQAFDVWFAAHSTMPELRDAQVLLAGMPTGKGLLEELAGRVRAGGSSGVGLGVADKEIRDVMLRLRWCPWNAAAPRDKVHDKTAAVSRALLDCYGRGKRTELKDV